MDLVLDLKMNPRISLFADIPVKYAHNVGTRDYSVLPRAYLIR